MAPTATYATGLSVWNAAVGDVNGDGKPDVVVGNTQDAVTANKDNSVGVFLGHGDGTFAAMVTSPYVPVSQQPTPGGVALADFNGDGKLDVVGAGGANGANPQFLPGNGDGTFGAAVAIPVAGVAAYTPTGYGIDTADFNGDGKPDLLVGTQLKCGVLLNSGSAQFSEVDYALTGQSAGFAVADLNGDGKPDVAAVDAQHGKIEIFYNSGTGQFGAPQTYTVATGPDSSGQRVAAADFNGDGKVDLAVSNEAETITVLTNIGNTTFGMPAYYTVTNNIGVSLVAADMNGDGKPDLALSEGAWATVEVLFNNGDGTFAGSTIFNANKPAGAMVAGNFKGTGVLGLVVVNNKDQGTTGQAGAISALIGTCQ
jgi:hypothetical protein